MRTRKPYQLKMCVEVVGGDGLLGRSVKEVKYAECSCPAGKAPSASCKHLAAFLYAMEEFCRFGYTHDAVTCSDDLQAWKSHTEKKAESMLLQDIVFAKGSRAKVTEPVGRERRSSEAYHDPRAVGERGMVNNRLNALLPGMGKRSK